MKNTLVELLMFSRYALRKRLKAFINYIACTIEPVRKGRSYPGKRTRIKKNNIHYSSYKRAK